MTLPYIIRLVFALLAWQRGLLGVYSQVADTDTHLLVLHRLVISNVTRRSTSGQELE